MTIMQQKANKDKRSVLNRLDALWAQVEAAAREGTPVHELERGLFDGVLKLGHDLWAIFSV